MKSKLILFFIISACFLFFIFDNPFFNISEEIIYLESGDSSILNNVVDENINFSGEYGYEYDVLVDDDTITFYDENGSSIIYVFSNDRLENVLNVFNMKTVEEANVVETYYKSMVGNGKIKRVVAKDTIVSVVLDMEQFAEYRDYSRESLEKILLKDANLVEEE
ncbi:MAG: hypothetical protein IJX99_05975 [Clostridia bacterium]|nr:hypothetical protein [Clostridia bacterium]